MSQIEVKNKIVIICIDGSLIPDDLHDKIAFHSGIYWADQNLNDDIFPIVYINENREGYNFTESENQLITDIYNLAIQNNAEFVQLLNS